MVTWRGCQLVTARDARPACALQQIADAGCTARCSVKLILLDFQSRVCCPIIGLLACTWLRLASGELDVYWALHSSEGVGLGLSRG